MTKKSGSGREPTPSADKKAPAADNKADVYEAKQTFHGGLADGTEILVTKGERVRAGHAILKRWPDLFEPLKVHYDIEDATAEPGSKRGANPKEKR